MIVGVLTQLLRAGEKRGKPDLNILFQYNMPLRGLAQMTGGIIGECDLLAVRKISSGEAVHISITDFELPGQDLLLHTVYHLLYDLYAAHELF